MQFAIPSIDAAVSSTLSNYNEAVVVSTTGGEHNIGSAHSDGNAVDIRVYSDPNTVPPNFRDRNPTGWITDAQATACVNALTNSLGNNYTVLNELARPANQAVWGGPHIHIQHNGN